MRRSANQAGIRVLPVGTDLIGLRSDHVAFESRSIPCLFFSSGLYRDYHKPTDTADNLNYREFERAAQVILLVKTVRPMLEVQVERHPNYAKSIGQLARSQLIEVTEEDFGEDGNQWEKFIKSR